MTMDLVKFGRNYRVTVNTPSGDQIVIQPPFTMEMDITRNALSSANVCQVRLYNLAQDSRELIRFNASDNTQFNQIILEAGYGDNLYTIFNGNVSRAWSVREGVNFITQIECYDGGFGYVNGTVNLSFPAGTPIKTVILTLMQYLPNVEVGGVGNFDGVLQRANTYSGNPAQLLFDLTGGAFFVDAAKAYVFKDNEYNAVQPVIIIDAATGLLNTPVREQTIANFEMLFEPTMNVGSLASVLSLTNPELNGVYKITSIKHRGIISQVVSGTLITVAQFLYMKTPVPVVGIP